MWNTVVDLFEGILKLVRRDNFLFPPFCKQGTGILAFMIVIMNKDSLTESSEFQKLWRSQLEGDRKKFGKYYLKSHNQLTMYCLGYLRDLELAENVASEVLVNMLHKENPEASGDVESWLFANAKSECMSHIRKEKASGRQSGSGSSDKAQDAAGTKFSTRKIRDIINATLSKKDLEIWNLYQQGFDNEQIGNKLQMAEKTVANRKIEVRNQLREALNKAG